ncbi:MAG: condensation domain-containing protein [Leptolyngbyaceae cyanobacterium MO_188.B28]|nr:condensation domain-containing protein [Leptolyngbyaceae cyanobacterium MO_188.B28]
MKAIDEFLSDLRRLDVQLWLDGDNLRIKAPKGTPTSTLLAQLKERKPEILTFLRQTDSVPQTAAAPIQPISRQVDPPLSFAQQRLWFLTQLEPDSSAYNMCGALSMKGVLNVNALERSLSEIVRRHEALRTHFPTVAGQPIQIISPDLVLSLPLIDFQHLPVEQRQATALQHAAEEAQQPFDLAQGPLLRAKLLRLAAEEHILMIEMHHIVSDGWSFDIFERELSALYATFSESRPSPLPKLPIQYADFAVWQRQWLQGEILESQLNYWKQHLGAPLPVLDLPTDRRRPAVQTYHGRQQWLAISEDLTEALQSLSQQQGGTLFITLLAAFQTLLYRYCGQDDIIVGSPIAGRNRVETEGIIVFFVNNLALRTYLGGDPSFRELLTRTREAVLGAYSNQDLPFEKLVEALNLERDQSRTPLFQVMFILQNFASQPLELAGLILKPLKVPNSTAKFDLTLVMGEMDQKMRGFFEYNTDLFDQSTITQMLSNYQTLLENIVANPDQRLSDFPLQISAKPRQQIGSSALSTSESEQPSSSEKTVKPIEAVLSDLRRLGVKLWLDGENLRYKATKEAPPPTLLAQLRERKAEVLTFLRQVKA